MKKILTMKQFLVVVNDKARLLYLSVDQTTPFNISKILYYNKPINEIEQLISGKELYWKWQ